VRNVVNVISKRNKDQVKKRNSYTNGFALEWETCWREGWGGGNETGLRLVKRSGKRANYKEDFQISFEKKEKIKRYRGRATPRWKSVILERRAQGGN